MFLAFYFLRTIQIFPVFWGRTNVIVVTTPSRRKLLRGTFTRIKRVGIVLVFISAAITKPCDNMIARLCKKWESNIGVLMFPSFSECIHGKYFYRPIFKLLKHNPFYSWH